MDADEQKFRETEHLLNRAGYTLSDFIRETARRNSSLLMIDDNKLKDCNALYNAIKEGGLAKGEKGKKLEELSNIVFKDSVENLFDVYKNCRTSTNEIDLLIRWTENARLAGINSAFPCFGETFLCECKNYDGPVNVTFVGKFSSLMAVTNTNFGVMVSWDGVTGRSKWSDSKGLIKKIALREKRYIVVLDKDDLKRICDKKDSVFSLIFNKYTALKMETDYDKYILKHEAENVLR